MKGIFLTFLSGLLLLSGCSKEDSQLELDLQIMDEYLLDNQIDNVSETSSGLHYVITEQGIGGNAGSGQTVSVNYAGYVLDGRCFDTSIEAIARANNIYSADRVYTPIEFILGQGRVIEGWDEGITLLNTGAKATFYIPSTLGYGNRQVTAEIVANSILIFDVELVNIK